MIDPSQKKLVEQIHGSGRQLVVSITGGGSGAIPALLEVPGASASVLQAIVPYSSRSLQQWLGGAVDQYCTEKTARAMAMRAFDSARQLSDFGPYLLGGVGATASLATNRTKRGSRRIHVAWQTASTTAVITCLFKFADGNRAQEERICTQLILNAAAEVCAISAPPLPDCATEIEIEHRQQQAPPAWQQLWLGQQSSVAVPAAEISQPAILFPGAFNPLHWGHEQMANVAARHYGLPVIFELSTANVDKPPLDFLEVADRLQNLAPRPALLTRAPTFVEKARLLPGCVFVVGTDTVERIADPVYYGHSHAHRDAAIAELASLGCRFLVFGRYVDGRFTPLSGIDIPDPLRALCDEVPESEFSADVSSTQLRRAEPP